MAPWGAQQLELTFQSDREFVPPMAGRKLNVDHRCLVPTSVFEKGLRAGLRRWLDTKGDVEDERAERYRAVLAQR